MEKVGINRSQNITLLSETLHMIIPSLLTSPQLNDNFLYE